MATKTAGGRITGRIGLTLEAQAALEVGNPVMVTGPYECDLADGSAPVVGIVTVANKIRTSSPTSTTYPDDNVPGDVSVDALGYAVWTLNSGAAISAGEEVGIDSTGRVAPAGVGVVTIGVALTDATAADEDVDVLAR